MRLFHQNLQTQCFVMKTYNQPLKDFFANAMFPEDSTNQPALLRSIICTLHPLKIMIIRDMWTCREEEDDDQDVPKQE